MKRLACIRITYETLAELLELTGLQQIVDVFASVQERRHQYIDVVIKGAETVNVPEGTEIPIIRKYIRNKTPEIKDANDYSYYAIVIKLIEILDLYEGQNPLVSNQGQALDGYSGLAEFVSLAKKARGELSGEE